MRLLTQQSVGIACPVQKAYAYVADMERFGEWFPAVLSIESLNALAAGEAGKVYLETVAGTFGGTQKIKLVVKAAEPNRLFVTEGEFPPLLPRMEVDFQATSDRSCSVTWRMFSRNEGFLVGFTIVPLARKIMRQRATVALQTLKHTLERAH